MNIILLGPPGSGKGTQSDKLLKEFNLRKISTGDILRKEIETSSSAGIKIKSIIDKGLFVSDDLINDLIEKILSNKKYSGRLIFDGYPRNINQVKKLEVLLSKYNQKISCALILNVEKNVITKRILGRVICSKCGLTFNNFFNPPKKENHKCNSKYLMTRSDDNEKTINYRFDTYLKETLPIINYYRDQNLLKEVNGMKEIDTIYEEIREIIRSLRS